MSRRPFVLGLTGSIGMGKSTTAGFFREAGIPVWDADAAVHRLYAKGGRAVPGIAAMFPDAAGPDGIDRARLKSHIARDPANLKRIEAVVHPLVGDDRAAFILQCAESGADLLVVDVPLLFEGGNEKAVDAVLVVTAPQDVQRDRVLARPGMTEDHFRRILAAQMPDAEKRKRADYVVETDTLQSTRAEILRIIAELRAKVAGNA